MNRFQHSNGDKIQREQFPKKYIDRSVLKVNVLSKYYLFYHIYFLAGSNT